MQPGRAWYFYKPDGAEAGRLDEERIHTEHGELISTFSQVEGHPTSVEPGRLVGTWRARTQRDQRLMRYNGPDYLGSTAAYGQELALGQLLMPQAGFNLRVTAWPEAAFWRFSHALEPVMYGLGFTTSAEIRPPYWPGAIAERWQGSQSTFDAAGEHLGGGEVVRRCQGLSFQEEGASRLRLEIELWAPYYLVSGAAQGIAKLYGWALSYRLAAGADQDIEGLEVLVPGDPPRLRAMRRWWQAGRLMRVENMGLHAAC